MHKLVVLYRKPPDPAQFRTYYEGTHLPLAGMLSGVIRMNHSFDVAGMGDAEPPYFCVFECLFESEAAMDAALNSPEGRAVGADVGNYAHAGFDMLHYPVPDEA